MVYQWKNGTRIKADAEKVGVELEKIKGDKTPEMVVEAARNSKLELHKCFQWDDTEAAKSYRLEQARYILRHISIVKEVVDTSGEEKTIVVRAYENVNLAPANKEERRAYVPTEKALKVPDLRVQVFARLDATIAEAQKTVEDYGYLSDEMPEVMRGLVVARAAIHRATASI